MRRALQLVLVILLLTTMLVACGGEPQSHLEAIEKEGKLLVGTSADYPPFEYVDENGEFAGFDIELAREIGQRIGVEVEIVDMPFDSLVAGVQEGKIDIVLAAMAPSEERDQAVDFTDSYYWYSEAWLVAEDFDESQLQTVQDLAKFTVGVQTATTSEPFILEQLVDTGLLSADDFFRYERVDQAALDVKAGRLDVLQTDYVPLVEMAKELGGLKLIRNDDLPGGPTSVAVPEGDSELAEKINTILAELEAEGFITDLESRLIAAD